MRPSEGRKRVYDWKHGAAAFQARTDCCSHPLHAQQYQCTEELAPGVGSHSYLLQEERPAQKQKPHTCAMARNPQALTASVRSLMAPSPSTKLLIYDDEQCESKVTDDVLEVLDAVAGDRPHPVRRLLSCYT